MNPARLFALSLLGVTGCSSTPARVEDSVHHPTDGLAAAVVAATSRPRSARSGIEIESKVGFAAGEIGYRDKSIGASQVGASMYQLRAALVESYGMGLGIDARQVVAAENVYSSTPDESAISQLDTFLYAEADGSGEDYRLAVRFGPYFQFARFEQQRSGIGRDYVGFGGRLELEPEYRLLGRRERVAAVFSRFAVGVHSTSIRDGASQGSYDSTGRTYDLEAGLRFQFGKTHFSVSWLERNTTTRDSAGPGAGLEFARVDMEFTGVTVSFRARF